MFCYNTAMEMKKINDLFCFREAGMHDLDDLKEMYGRIVKDMDEAGIRIWDSVYPCEVLADDIRKSHMYVFESGMKIAGAFALCRRDDLRNAVSWHDCRAEALYIERLAVSVRWRRRHLGDMIMKTAALLAERAGVQYVRLFVADINIPAILLYRENGYEKVQGVYDELLEDGSVLHESGYEIRIG